MDQLPAWSIDSSNIWLIGQPQKEEILRQCSSLLPGFSRGFSQEDSHLSSDKSFPFVSQCLCCVLGSSTTYSFWIASWWWVNGLCTLPAPLLHEKGYMKEKYKSVGVYFLVSLAPTWYSSTSSPHHTFQTLLYHQHCVCFVSCVVCCK